MKYRSNSNDVTGKNNIQLNKRLFYTILHPDNSTQPRISFIYNTQLLHHFCILLDDVFNMTREVLCRNSEIFGEASPINILQLIVEINL